MSNAHLPCHSNLWIWCWLLSRWLRPRPMWETEEGEEVASLQNLCIWHWLACVCVCVGGSAFTSCPGCDGCCEWRAESGSGWPSPTLAYRSSVSGCFSPQSPSAPWRQRKDQIRNFLRTWNAITSDYSLFRASGSFFSDETLKTHRLCIYSFAFLINFPNLCSVSTHNLVEFRIAQGVILE